MKDSRCRGPEQFSFSGESLQVTKEAFPEITFQGSEIRLAVRRVYCTDLTISSTPCALILHLFGPESSIAKPSYLHTVLHETFPAPYLCMSYNILRTYCQTEKAPRQNVKLIGASSRRTCLARHESTATSPSQPQNPHPFLRIVSCVTERPDPLERKRTTGTGQNCFPIPVSVV